MLKQAKQGYWGERIVSEWAYAKEISTVHGGKYDVLLQEVEQE